MAAADVERVADEFLASEHALQIAAARKGARFTTRRVWEIEQGALDTAQRMRAEGTRPAGAMIAERALCARPTLKGDQREMVRRLLADREGVVVVIGEAGTGKSYAILAAARGWSEAGIELRVARRPGGRRTCCAPRGCGRAASPACWPSLSAPRRRAGRRSPRARCCSWTRPGWSAPPTSPDCSHHAAAAEAKLVLVGDPEQLGEIEAGGLFGALAERTEPIRLDEVIRHDSEVEREGARLIREGEGARGA